MRTRLAVPTVTAMAATVVTVVVLLPVASGQAAHAATWKVPGDQPTIQAAVDAAAPGDTIEVGNGDFCGATITKPVHLRGRGNTTIVGCSAPVLFGALRVGFFLPDGRASGTTIERFRFDGAGVSNDDLEPLAFAVFARDADDVEVVDTRITGTVQAITNTNGDGWLVADNDIRDLTLFTCPGHCGGGAGIVMQRRIDDGVLAWGNVVVGNRIEGVIPDGHGDFGMTGVFVVGQDSPVVDGNRLRIPENPDAGAPGVGVHVAGTCCGNPDPLPPTIDAIVVDNDGHKSEIAVIVDLGNAVGAFIANNKGVNIIEGVTANVP
jgi:hypothetical protein